MESFLEPEVGAFLESGFLMSLPSASGGDSGELWVGWGAHSRSPVAGVPQDQVGVYAPDFFLEDPRPVWIFAHSARIRRESLLLALTGYAQTLGLAGQTRVDLNFSEPSFEPFRSVFLDLQAKFKRGELKKAVPFVVSEAPGLLGAGDRLLLLIELLRNTAGVPVHLYGVWDEAQGVLGGTPEILFSKGLDSTLSAVALAGTRIHDLASDGKSSALALLDDPKEREEHQLVIDGILSSLQASFPSSLRDFKTGKCFELVLPTLSHLCTPLYFCVQTSADSEEPQGGPYFEFERLVRALHPTPALGAFPKEAGREWLAALQKGVDRKRFGAPFGAIVPGGQWHCWVGIRNIQWDVNSVQIYAGCGVITASVLEREWLELLGKVQAIKRMLGL